MRGRGLALVVALTMAAVGCGSFDHAPGSREPSSLVSLDPHHHLFDLAVRGADVMATFENDADIALVDEIVWYRISPDGATVTTVASFTGGPFALESPQIADNAVVIAGWKGGIAHPGTYTLMPSPSGDVEARFAPAD